jgi:hypothetical protein
MYDRHHSQHSRSVTILVYPGKSGCCVAFAVHAVNPEVRGTERRRLGQTVIGVLTIASG